LRTLAHISDLHFGEHDDAAAAALLGTLGALAPDLVVVSGDLTQRARRWQFEAARDFLARIEAPVLVTPGNHDLAPFWYPWRRWLRPFSRYERYISRERYPFFSDGEIAVLALNTARRSTVKSGRVSHAQIAEMRHVFDALPAKGFRILVTHHPLITPAGAFGRNDRAGRAAAALRTARALDIRLLLSGHYHQARSGAEPAEIAENAGSLLVAHAGTAISVRTRWEENSFNLLRIAARTVEIALMGWSSGADAFAVRRRDYFGLAPGGWKPLAAPAPP
jgi:3',5'-cyclic AMP phosphodiesterase CpdA